MLPEVARILALPRIEGMRAPPTNAHTLRLPGPSPAVLRPGQLAALGEAQRERGLLGVIGVGQGKLLISLLAPSVIEGVERPLLLVPAQLVPQTRTELQRWSAVFRVHPNLKVMSYNDLSTATGQAALQAHNPDLIIADECHHLRHRTAARTRRLVRWFQENPTTLFVALSGTITSRSVADFDHLSELALRERSPLPREWLELEAWAAVMDAHGEPTSHQTGAVAPLLAAFPKAANAREAFLMRLRSAPGVICTIDTSAAECSLRLEPHRLPDPPPALRDALRDLRRAWVLPDGTEILRASDFAAAERQLQSGFYYVWDWGAAGPDQEWLAARAAWSAEVRSILARRLPFVDSPLQAETWVRSRPNTGAAAALAAWEAIEDRCRPPQVARWVSYAVMDATLRRVEALEHDHGAVLVWVESVAVMDVLESMGLDVLRPGQPVPTKPRTLVLSRHSHGVGRNLQGWSTNLLVEPMSSGTAIEQLIGRTHREGQEADEVYIEVIHWTALPLRGIEAAMEDARYVETSTGQRQKLLLCSGWSARAPEKSSGNLHAGVDTPIAP